MGVKITSADKEFSIAVRSMAGWKCEHCDRSGRTECAHLYGRRAAVTRWDMLNAVSLCHACHRRFTENPMDFTSWIESIHPGRWDILNEKRRAHLKNNEATRKEVTAHYRTENQKKIIDPDYRIVSYI